MKTKRTKQMFNKRNISLLMDFYELTMSNGYFLTNKYHQKAIFDIFYRSNPDGAAYSIYVGLNEIIEYINNLSFDSNDIKYLRNLKIFDENFLIYLKDFKFKGDLYSFKEGSIIYPNEPIITVVAPLIDCQLIETALLLLFNHESLIATKTNRIVLSAKGRTVSDFGARRAHNADSAIYGARASYIGGASSTATTIAAKMFKILVNGTMAHSWVMSFDSEEESFLAYAKIYPSSSVFLIDTYDVINSGIKNAIKVAKEFLIPNGNRLKGVRIDSGDLAYLSKEVRKILDENDLADCKIIASNSLDEFKIESLINQGAKIDSFGVGENLITSKSDPVFGGVYKLSAIEENDQFIPKIKISNTIEKITNPGFKEVYRIYSKENKVVADLIALHDEKIDLSHPFKYIDPNKPWKTNLYFTDCHYKKMKEQIFKDGKLIYKQPSIEEIRDFVRFQINNELWEEEKRFILPHIHYIDYTPSFNKLKLDLISQYQHE